MKKDNDLLHPFGLLLEENELGSGLIDETEEIKSKD